MSDFLTRLVTATYGAAPVMQPRPVAQYEPVTTPLPVWPQAVEAASPVAPGEMTGSTAFANPASAPGLSMAPSSTPVDNAGRSAPGALAFTIARPLAAPAAPQERRHDALALQNAARLDAPLESPGGTARHTHEAGAAGAAPPVNTSMPPASPPLTANWQPISLPVAPAPSSPRLSNAQIGPEPRHAPVAPLPTTVIPASGASHRIDGSTPVPATQRTRSAAPLPPASLAVQRAALAAGSAGDIDDEHSAQGTARRSAQLPGRTAPDLTPRLPVAQSETSAAPAPVVRVTIGRIVIKTEQAAPVRAAAAQPAKPALSLDHYLQGRNGGET